MIKSIGRSLFKGAATILDIGGTMSRPRTELPPEMIDKAAIRSDWEAVGKDLRWAMNKFGRANRLSGMKNNHPK